MSLYGSAVKRPIMTTLCFVAVIIMGIFSYIKLPIDLLPDIETNTLMVITMYPGASAEDIEQNVTKPLENTLNSVEHLKHITSDSRENTSVITLEFEFGYDIDVLTNDVRDKLDMVESSLPDNTQNPIIFKFSTDMIPIMMIIPNIIDPSVPIGKDDSENVELKRYLEPKVPAFEIPYHLDILALKKRNAVSVELYISDDKSIFHKFYQHKDDIEANLGFKLDWRELPDKKASRIIVEKSVNLENHDEWSNQFDWIADTAVRFKKTFKKYF